MPDDTAARGRAAPWETPPGAVRPTCELGCRVCGRTAACCAEDVLRFSRAGWPVCCGEVMAYHTDTPWPAGR